VPPGGVKYPIWPIFLGLFTDKIFPSLAIGPDAQIFFCNSVSLFFLLAHSIKQTNTGEAHFRPPLYHKNRILNSENMCVLGDISPELSDALPYSRLSKLFVREIRLLIILKDNVKINICSKKI